MDNLLIKERDKLDKVSRDALEQLMFKDQIIEELRSKLSKEQLENIGMKTKLKEFEDKINFLEEKLEKEENTTFTMQNKFLNTNNNFSDYSNNNNNKNLERINQEQQQFIEKLTVENKGLSARALAQQAEIEIWKEKSKAIAEIEEIYKHQMDQLRKRAENSDLLGKKLKEKESYIEDIISRYNALQNDYEVMINNKDFEIKELKAQVNVLSENNERFANQINLLSQNSNTLTQELYKELRLLSDKNKDLELKMVKTEQKYKDEVSSLKKILEESSSNINNNNNNNDKNDLGLLKQDSTSMRVEDLATSLSKSIREKIESQNKKISSQNIEILQLQYELEKIKSDLKYEKELNSKLQSALADLKCKNIQTQNKALSEEAQTQTTLKFDDLEAFKIKAKILEDNLIKASEESEGRFKKIENLKESNTKLTKECREKEKEINSLVKKIEKLQLNDRSLERELATVTNISKLNMTVSALKMREAELLERIQNFEVEKEKNFNNNNNNNNNNGYYQSVTNNSNYSNYNSNLQNNLNLNYNYAKVAAGHNANYSQGFGNVHAANNNFNNQYSDCSQNNSFNTTGFNNNNNNNTNQNQNNNNNNAYNQNFSQNPVNFNASNNNFNNTFNNNNTHHNPNINNNNNNISNPSFNNNSQNNQNNSALNNTTQNKDLLIEKYELDLKRIQEDCFYLKDQNFRLESENNKLTEQANSLRTKLTEDEAEKDSLVRDKNQLSDNYEKIISSLKEELEKQRSFGNQSIEDMRENLKKIQDTNTKLSDQFNSLQNKFYVQTQLIQEKNLELASEGKIIDSLKKDNEELIENQTKLVEKLKALEKQNTLSSAEKEKMRKELVEAKEKLTDLTLKSNFNKAELEERTKILIDENKNLREINTQLKSKMGEMYEEIKEKDNKLLTVLKEEARELEAKMRQELSELRLENEQLLKERSAIRLQFNELKYENELLKEQLNISGQSGVYSPQNLIKLNVNASNTSAIIQNDIYGSNNINTGSNFASSQESNANNNIKNIDNNLNNTNNNPNYISYLSAPLVKTSMDAEKIKTAILNQNNTHMQEIIKDNKYLEQENDFIKNENSKLQSELDALSKRFIALENTLKDSKLDFDAVQVEKDKLADSLLKRELEAKDLKLELNLMQNEINKLKEKVIDYSAEISVKNQTINKLLDNLDAEKNNGNKKFGEMEETFMILRNERNKFEEKSELLSKEFKAEKEKYKFDLADLRKENEILIGDLEKKENEANSLFEKLSSELSELQNINLTQKNFIENLTKENSDLKNEKSELDAQVTELSVLALERLEKQNEKLQKSKAKLEKLVDLYESHIKFLKNKFDSSLHDFILSVKFKQGNLSEKDAEKFKAIMKSLENTSELMNQIAGREALIAASKEEIKALKLSLSKATENLKMVLKEKEDMQAVLNVKKLQMKVKEKDKLSVAKGKGADIKQAPGDADNSSFLRETPLCKNCLQSILKIESLLRQVTELKVDEKEIEIERNFFKAEIKKMEEINKDLAEKLETAQKHIESLRIEQAKKEKELLDSVKLHKGEVSKIIEELKKIKEKWISPEKHAEKVDELESKVKTQKNEITRKNDMINLLKSQLAQAQLGSNNTNNNNSLNNTTNNASSGLVYANTSSNINAGNNNNIASLEEKIKAMQKELNRKDVVIKEFKANLESLRASEKKLSEENATIVEKNKILKIDVNRKDEIIKDYKDKYNLLNLTQKNQNTSIFEGRSALGGDNSALSLANQTSDNNNSSAAAQQTQIKKLKNDIDRKDDIIKTLKAKLENANNEIEQMKTMSVKNSKNNYSELEKEQKRNENLRSKVDSLLIKNENLISIIRRVFKDLILTYEKNSVKSKMNNLDKSSLNYKDGMDILNISADELEDYLNPSADNFQGNNGFIQNNSASKANFKNIKNAYDNINYMLDSDNIDSDAFVDLFYSVKEKIFECNSHNNNSNNNNFDDNNFNKNFGTTFSKNNMANTTPVKNNSGNANANVINNQTINNKNHNNNISNISTINNNTNFTNTANQRQQSKSIYDNSSFQTPITNDSEPKLKKYQNLLNKVKGGDNRNNNVSFDNINFDGIMNDLQKIKK